MAYALWAISLNQMYPGHPEAEGKNHYMFSEAFQVPEARFFEEAAMVATGQRIYDTGQDGKPNYQQQAIFDSLP